MVFKSHNKYDIDCNRSFSIQLISITYEEEVHNYNKYLYYLNSNLMIVKFNVFHVLYFLFGSIKLKFIISFRGLQFQHSLDYITYEEEVHNYNKSLYYLNSN